MTTSQLQLLHLNWEAKIANCNLRRLVTLKISIVLIFLSRKLIYLALTIYTNIRIISHSILTFIRERWPVAWHLNSQFYLLLYKFCPLVLFLFFNLFPFPLASIFVAFTKVKDSNSTITSSDWMEGGEDPWTSINLLLAFIQLSHSPSFSLCYLLNNYFWQPFK